MLHKEFLFDYNEKSSPRSVVSQDKESFSKKKVFMKNSLFLENDWKGYTEGCFMSLHDWICVHWKISEMKGWIDFSSLILAWRGFICFLDQKKGRLNITKIKNEIKFK